MLQFYKTLLLGLFCLMFAFSSYSQIHSTSNGGDWADEETWIGGIIPGAGHDVVINGTVDCYASDQCNNITVTSSGALRNDYYSGTLIVNGNLINNGSIHNYSSYLYLQIKGNITNNGTWSNYNTKLTGTLDQSVVCNNGNSFSGYQFLVEKPSGDLNIDGVVNFENCEVWMFDNHINLQANSTIHIHNKFLRDCIIYGDGTTSVIHGVGVYNSDAPNFTDVDFNDLSITGEVNIYAGCSTHGTVTNNGIISNDYYSATFLLYDDFINNGSLINYSSYLYLNVYGNFTNNHVVDNHVLDFYGDDHQYILLAAGKVFSPSYMTVHKTGGIIEALTDLTFDNVAINWQGIPLLIPNNSLISLSDGNFSNGVVEANDAKSGSFTYHSENGATTDNTSFTNVTLTGLFKCDTQNNFLGTTNNNGTFENNYYNHTAHLFGHFINNGSINNYFNYLTLDIYGDFTNNGVVDHQNMYFKGDGDQNISLLDGEIYSPHYFECAKPSGNLVAQSDLSFSYTSINMVDDVLLLQDDGTLSLTGGYITNATILDTDSPNGYLHLHLTKDAYIHNSTVTNPELLGLVDVNDGNIFLGEILVSDTVRNDYYSFTLNIEGNITNNGIIQNYYNYFSINITGNIEQNGVWQNYHTYLIGTIDQHVTCLNNNSFSGAQFHCQNTSGLIYFDSEVGFHNTQVKFENNNLELPENSMLKLHGAYLTNCNLHGNGETSVVHGEGVYNVDGPDMHSTTLEDVKLTGDWGIGANNIMNGTIINDGRLQNDFSSFTLVVNADFINNGTIRSYYNYLYMYMYGNVTNNGIWGGRAIDLYGDSDQEIFLADGKIFNPNYFTSFKPSGDIIATSDLIFEDTWINLEHDPLIMPDNSTLSVSNHRLYRANVSSETDRFNLLMNNGAHLLECELQDVNLYGIVDVNNSNVFNGKTINYGTMQNDFYSFTVNFYGDLINNGMIQNYYNYFYINAHADITNNGSWTNYYTSMVGTAEQHVYLTDGNWINGEMRFVSDIQTGPYQWYLNGGAIVNPPYPTPPIINGETSATLKWISPVNNSWVGTYKCWDGGVWSRNIIIEETYNIRLDLTANFEGPYNGTDMNTDLNDILPTHQPYNTYPWEYDGGESVISIPENAVDWLLVELRDATDASLATPATSLGGQAAFILNDGSIVGLDGISPLSFDFEIDNQLYVLLWHRNHLPVMSMTAVPQSGGIYLYDFTTSASKAYGNNQSDLGGGAYGMIGGDANGDGTVNEFDGVEAWLIQAGKTGYFGGDVNMDMQINNPDKNDIWLPNYGKSEILPE